MKVVIIGGVAGGATAAARLRRLDESAEILVLERSGFVSYANCGLPYYVGGVIQEKEALTLQTPESFWRRFRIQVRVKNEVLAIHPDTKTLSVRRLETGEEYAESYDKLILAPGAKAVRPPLPGIDGPRVMTLRTVEDTLRIREYLEQRRPKRAVVVGGGFIGLEAAENLLQAGVQTTLLEGSPQVLPPLDPDMVCRVHALLREKGMDLRLNQKVAGFSEEGGRFRVLLAEGEPVEADFAVLSIGVAPDTALAKEAGLALGQRGAIVVNERMETSLADIYAVGDAVEVKNFVTGRPALFALAGPANKQGRIAAGSICEGGGSFAGSQGTSVIKLFHMTAASTGLSEKAARAEGIAWDKAVITSASHATYYPGASNMVIKVLFAPDTGKILGAQIVGAEGVDKRIDVLATAIRAGMTAEDLTQLELAYAPPYSSAKDPVNMMGFVIENLRAGLVKQYHWHDVAALPRDGSVVLLDVRTPGEYGRGHIPDAVNIPLDELRERLGELDQKKPLYVNCQSGLRSYIACRILAQEGYECYNLSGGYSFYESAVSGVYDSAPTHPCGVKL